MSGTRFSRAAALTALVLSALTFAAPSASAGAGTELGAYRSGGDPAGVAEFERWTGSSVQYRWALDFLPSRDWASIESAAWSTSMWGPSRFKTVYSIPLIPDTGGTLAQGASGAYNGHFQRLAETLVAGGEGDAVLRLGWEFNGDWFRWKASSDPAAFAAYWRQVVQTMRVVPGANFKFDWCPVLGTGAVAPPLAYPGDAYVDYIGLDAYDQDWLSGWQNPTQRWQNLLNQAHGLKWHRDFAAAHRKPMTFPEWGLFDRPDGHGGGDDPYFIQKMYEWIGANNVAYALYFEHDPPHGRHALMNGQFPRGAATFRKLFGAGLPGATPPRAKAPDTVLAAPRNLEPPRIAGLVAKGKALTATPGLWADPAPLTFSYRWERCRVAGKSCVPISGAVRSTFVPKAKDVGRALRVRLTARNSAGRAMVFSPPTRTVRAAARVSAPQFALSHAPLQNGLWRSAIG